MGRSGRFIRYLIIGCLFPLMVLAEEANEGGKAESAPEDPAEIYRQAMRAVGLQDVREAIKLLRKAAWENYIPAQVYLAEYLDVAEYDDEAVGWFMTAAYQGNPPGAFGLAKMYAGGEGIDKSEEKAFFWFKFAAERDHIGAVKVMVATYNNGLFGQQADSKKAQYWANKLPALEKAAEIQLMREEQTYRKKLKESREKRKAGLEEAKKRFSENQALEEDEALKDDEVTPPSED